MATHIQSHRQEKRGNPAGTYFAVTVLAVLLVCVAIYFAAVHLKSAMDEPNDIRGSFVEHELGLKLAA